MVTRTDSWYLGVNSSVQSTKANNFVLLTLFERRPVHLTDVIDIRLDNFQKEYPSGVPDYRYAL